MDHLYLKVLQGHNVTIDNYYGFYLSGDGAYIHVQGAGSWAHKSDDKQAFLDDAQKLADRHGDGTASVYTISK